MADVAALTDIVDETQDFHFGLHLIAIAEFVSNLEGVDPFSDVSLDFSRTRSVRGFTAREFRLSFRIDLEVKYVQAMEAVDSAAGETTEEADHG